MSTIHKDIRDAVKARIVANWTATRIHWANTGFNPGNTAWIRPRVYFQQPVQVTLGPQGHNRIPGDLHINVFYPHGAGEDEALLRAGELRALFPRGLILPTATKAAIFQASGPIEAIEDEEWFQVPVVCPFFADEVPA